MTMHSKWRRPGDEVIRRIYTAQFGRCFYCGMSLVVGKENREDERYGTVDHVRPRTQCSRREIGNPDNMVLACWGCNHRKDAMPLICFLVNLHRTITT